MKNNDLHSRISKIQKRFQSKDKFYGTTTMGARGQVVIPVEARKDLNLNSGDQLVVMGKFGKVLGFMKAEQMAEFVETMMKNLDGTGMEMQFKKHFEKMINIKKLKK
jgi:AbrB family looped-hinge helix DNA binding protein